MSSASRRIAARVGADRVEIFTGPFAEAAARGDGAYSALLDQIHEIPMVKRARRLKF